MALPSLTPRVSRPSVALIPAAMAEEHLLDNWHMLAAQASEPNVFHAPWFLVPALDRFDPAGRARIAAVWDGAPGKGDLIGLMPLSLQPRYGRWPVPHWQNWLHHNAFLGTPLMAPGREGDVWDALLATLDRAPSDGLFLHLNGLVKGGPVETALASRCAATGRSYTIVDTHERALLQSDLSPEAYLEDAVRGKKRKELRRQRNRLSELGELTVQRGHGADGLDAWVDEFLALESAGWKGLEGSSLASAKDTATLLRIVMHGAASEDALDLLALRFEGEAVAMLVTLRSQRGAFSFKTAFNEAFARFSPGVLLQLENLQSLARPDIAWTDSCAAADHPMIDSLWTQRRTVVRASVAIGSSARRAAFFAFRKGEEMRTRRRLRAQASDTRAD